MGRRVSDDPKFDVARDATLRRAQGYGLAPSREVVEHVTAMLTSKAVD